MLDALQAIFPFAFPVLWIGGTVMLFFRGRGKQRAYLAHFPPVDGYPLDAPLYRAGEVNPFGEVARAIRQAVRYPQRDPELEHLRREMHRSQLDCALWIFLFPSITFGIVFLLYIVGILPTR